MRPEKNEFIEEVSWFKDVLRIIVGYCMFLSIFCCWFHVGFTVSPFVGYLFVGPLLVGPSLCYSMLLYWPCSGIFPCTVSEKRHEIANTHSFLFLLV